MSDLVHCFELDGGELTEGPLAAPAMVGAFDPEDDGQSELLPGLPALPLDAVAATESSSRPSIAREDLIR
jgi:hypothetical protein